ncbi:MAG TPA: tetratricopeptide repeat protein [Deltaproteobacteria bacterium]|nr:tetratricopeptide repeat protein [Deltaproteobacteria bacterium]
MDGLRRFFETNRAAAALIPFVLSALAVLALYSHVLHGPFLYDDLIYIVRNGRIRDLGALTDFTSSRYVTFATFALNYAVGGLSTFGYHLVNVAVHVFNGWLVYALVRLTWRTPVVARAAAGASARGLALTASLLFAVHPLQTQAVTYITQRFASLATFFYLASLVCYAAARLDVERSDGGLLRRHGLYVLSVAAALAAQKTKEIAFTLPFVIALYELAFFSGSVASARRRAALLVPYGLAALVIPLSFLLVSPGAVSYASGIENWITELQKAELGTLSKYVYFLTETRVLVTYLRLLVLPVNQMLLYDFPASHSILEPAVLASLAFLSLLLFGALYLFFRAKRLGEPYLLVASAGVIWFFVTSSVESSVIPIMDLIYEHRVYLPSVGALTALAALGAAALERLGARPRTGVALTAAAVVLLSVLTYQRNLVWTDALAFWADGAARAPALAKPRINLAIELMRLGRYDEAVVELEKAKRSEPRYLDIYYNLGISHVNRRDYRSALREFNRALEVLEVLKEGHYFAAASLEYEMIINSYLGNLYVRLGEPERALAHFERALAIKADNNAARYNYAVALDMLGRYEDAAAQLRILLGSDPSDSGARAYLDALLSRIGRDR